MANAKSYSDPRGCRPPARRRRVGTGRSSGFTLIELLVVIAIIVLLAGILVPSISSVLKSAYVTRSKTRIRNLADGIETFKMDKQNNLAALYPGQPADELESGGAFANNGSKLLRDALSNDNVEYVPFKENDTMPAPSGEVGEVSDKFGRKPMAILYYPSRVGRSDLAQYREDDNSAITDNTDPAAEWKNSEADGFENYIKDRRFDGNDSTTPYNAGSFLLIAAGKDRLYGTSDDLTNWK